MDFESLIKKMVQSFFIITTGVVVGHYVISLIFTPEAVYSVDDFGNILLCAFLSDLPLIVFYSRKELNKRQMLIRSVIHGIVLLAVLMIVAYRWDWINFSSPLELISYLLIIILVYVIIYTSSYLSDRKTADKLNEGLKKRYQK